MRHVLRCSSILTLILATSLVAAPPAPAAKADPRTNEQQQAAADFSFEGATLGMALKDFLEKYPKAEFGEQESNVKVGLKSYRVHELETADSARYVFLDDMLFQVTAFYTPARLKEMGGDTIPLRKLVQKLGKQDKNSPGIARQNGEESFTAKWDFPTQRRTIRFVAAQKMSYVSCVDTSKSGVANKRLTDMAELGF